MADNFAQTVKQQADIVKIVGEYVRLKKAGAQNYSGLCPFHSEKTPSFSVHAGRQFYHCFGCGVGGDVFSFIQKIENVSFPEAVKAVAVKCGIPLPKREFSSAKEAAESRQRGKLIELHEAVTAWFEQQLKSPEGALAREYLAGRGMTEAGIAKFRIGYAPDSFHALRERLAGMADEATLRASGLFSWKEQEDGKPGPLYARFRKRITFPIANESGRVIAFTARALESGDKTGPKYINSPETPLYTKGLVLFNLDKARGAIRETDFALLVEGQMDCISAYLAGISNVLATSGTAFTEAQVRLLKRYTARVIVNFDPDTAGANAAEKSIALLTEEGFEVKVVTLEGGLDPDRYIRERGVKEYMAALRGAKRYQDFLLEKVLQMFPPRTPEAKIKGLNYLLPYIRREPSRIGRDEFAMNAAQKLGIDSALVREELKEAAAKRRDSIAVPPVRPTRTDALLIRALAAAPLDECRNLVSSAVIKHPHFFEELDAGPLLKDLAERGDRDPIDSVADPQQREILVRALMDESQPLRPERIEDALHTLEQNYLEKRQVAIMAEIHAAQLAGDTAKSVSLATEQLNVRKRLYEIRYPERR